ncbi:SprT family zinc-dependent metalloprotease [Basfia succiniciproducens]|uniref:Protein SprT n=1 Tax=Basfia succiniciproducens TaxID=653940 RepID=A0A1G5CFS6_9PAST|nr:SprT family zinc-dependent metalloprotease [Basfia succiniciproducens]QIM68938.1 SprT family protein [Basfia succiniciproducens]SCY01138.1 SprT protein [Basfia succiniciproducens]
MENISELTGFRHLKMQVQRRLTNCLTLAETHFHRSFPMPTVTYQVRGMKAGVAYLQQNEIRLNRTLLLENSAEFIGQVVPHELAHLLVYQVFGRVKPHGVEWQTVMNNVFDLPANVYHRFDVKSVQGETFTYQCQCRTHQLSVRRHNRIQRDHAVYFCRKCRSCLSFVSG